MQDSYEDRILFVKIFNAYKAKKRDIGLEQEILALGDPDAACLYAIHVVKGAWEAAEHIITKAPAYDYRSGRLSRFPDADGELVIHYGRGGSNKTTNIKDPIHTDPKYNSNKYGQTTTRLITKTTTQIASAYTRLTKKRHVNFEKNTKIVERWLAKRVMGYVKLIYELTGEVADFENGLVAVKIIESIKENDFSKKPISHADKENIIKELEQRMTLYSFAGVQQDSEPVQSSGPRGRRNNSPLGAIKTYFETRVEAMNELFKILSEHDENMTIKELKKVLRNDAA